MPIKIKVTGMGCAHCVMKVTKAIESIAGIRDVKVDLKSGETTFDKPNTVNMEDILKAIERLDNE